MATQNTAQKNDDNVRPLLTPEAQQILREIDDSVPFNPYEAFRKSILDQSKDYPEPEPIVWLIIENVKFPLLTKKSYSLWQGKQKSKKTTVLALMAAAIILLVHNNDSVRFEAAVNGKVIIFDNEQGESYAARTMKLILKLANLDKSDNLIYCDLREYTPGQRVEIIKAAIEETENLQLVIIDGVVDLMNDFMDAKEGHKVITQILALCSKYNIHIAGVLHQNKGQSKEARAHVGSISSQKCEIEIMTEVDPDDRHQSIVSCKESRGLPFNDFAIRWDKGELPRIVQDYNSTKSTKRTKEADNAVTPGEVANETHRIVVGDIFGDRNELLRSELRASTQANLSRWLDRHVGLHKADDWINYWLNKGLLKIVGTPKTRSAKYIQTELEPVQPIHPI